MKINSGSMIFQDYFVKPNYSKIFGVTPTSFWQGHTRYRNKYEVEKCLSNIFNSIVFFNGNDLNRLFFYFKDEADEAEFILTGDNIEVKIKNGLFL